VADLLAALGAEFDAEHLRETLRRVAQAYAELLTPRPCNPTTFPNDERYDELVVVADIPFQSLCAHHLLPFHGRAHWALPAALREAVEAQWGPPPLAFSTRPRGRSHFTPHCLAGRDGSA
jgi:hypothetical protein